MEPWPNFLLLVFLPVYLQVLIVARVGLLLVFSMSGMNTLVVDLRSVHGQLLLSQGSLLTIRFCHLWPREEAAIKPSDMYTVQLNCSCWGQHCYRCILSSDVQHFVL